MFGLYCPRFSDHLDYLSHTCWLVYFYFILFFERDWKILMFFQPIHVFYNSAVERILMAMQCLVEIVDLSSDPHCCPLRVCVFFKEKSTSRAVFGKKKKKGQNIKGF